MQNFKNLLAQSNQRLKAACIRVKLEVKGDRVVLRGTFPPKPGSDRTEPYQQRIFLGTSANPAGLKYAEAEAKKVGALLDQKHFDWSVYLREEKTEVVLPQKDKTIADWIAEFEQDYFSKRARTAKSQLTWDGNYVYALRKLPPDAKLAKDVLIKTIKSKTNPDSRSRQIICFVYKMLAKFAGFELEVKELSGKYSPNTVEPKELPTDEEIYDWFFKIKNPQWRFVYGLMACYGLRNHEIFHLNFSAFPILNITEGKTGDRKVWPFPEKWLEPFDLANRHWFRQMREKRYCYI